MITKEQLQAMSDLEILSKLYELLGFGVHDYEFQDVITIKKGNKVTTAEMCPNDIMPLAFEYGVTVKCMACPAGSGFAHYAESYGGEFHTDYDKPCRVAAICLILVLQERNK